MLKSITAYRRGITIVGKITNPPVLNVTNLQGLSVYLSQFKYYDSKDKNIRGHSNTYLTNITSHKPENANQHDKKCNLSALIKITHLPPSPVFKQLKISISIVYHLLKYEHIYQSVYDKQLNYIYKQLMSFIFFLYTCIYSLAD